jgi:hypothetical protein
VKIHSADEENGDGPLAEFIRGQLALVAQLERATILDRVRVGKATRKRQGRHVQGSVAYGYRSVAAPDGKGRTLEPVEETAAVVRRIFDAARHGDTPGKISAALNTEGVSGPRGGVWNRTAVRGIIENAGYTGVRYGVKGAHAAIVSRCTFNAANVQLATRGRSSVQSREELAERQRLDPPCAVGGLPTIRTEVLTLPPSPAPILL